jgi:hypothetical protein
MGKEIFTYDCFGTPTYSALNKKIAGATAGSLWLLIDNIEKI